MSSTTNPPLTADMCSNDKSDDSNTNNTIKKEEEHGDDYNQQEQGQGQGQGQEQAQEQEKAQEEHHQHDHHQQQQHQPYTGSLNHIHHIGFHELEEIHCQNITLHLEKIDPPRSKSEKLRDQILSVLDMPIFQWMGIFVLFLVVVDGAIFFFFLMGWQTLCTPRMDCEPRNQIYNISVQILNGLFTYMVTASMPWRCTNFIHTIGWSKPKRNNNVGYNLYGFPSKDVWFFLSRKSRIIILTFLLINCLTQYANQVTRIIYWDFYLSNSMPGVIWTNIFFVLSFVSAGIGGGYMAYVINQKEKEYPGKFPLGPIKLCRKYIKITYKKCFRRCYRKIRKKKKTNKKKEQQQQQENVNEQQQQQQQVEDNLVDYEGVEIDEEENEIEKEEEEKEEEELDVDLEEEHSQSSHYYPDPTAYDERESVFPFSRGAMRLWGA